MRGGCKETRGGMEEGGGEEVVRVWGVGAGRQEVTRSLA